MSVWTQALGSTVPERTLMTISKWLTLASAAALLGGTACSDNARSRGDTSGSTGSATSTGTSNDNTSATGASPRGTSGTSGSASAPEGRRGATLPRARMDGGTDL